MTSSNSDLLALVRKRLETDAYWLPGWSRLHADAYDDMQALIAAVEAQGQLREALKALYSLVYESRHLLVALNGANWPEQFKAVMEQAQAALAAKGGDDA